MARLVPRIEVDEIEVKPERDVARALVAQLPNEFVVYHSYPWLRADRNDRDRTTFREGEADFVVVDPDRGLLVLEVKGGEIGYEPGSHTWYRQLGARRKEITDPFAQARRSLHVLADRIREAAFAGDARLPFAYGYAVVFPDCDDRGELPPGAEPAIVLSARDLPQLGRRAVDALSQWDGRPRPAPLSARERDGILRGLSPSFQLLPALWRTVEEQEERLVRLTDEQLRFLEFIADRRRAAVRGVAGSGKTLLARTQAQRFADQGLSTLFLCFNRALAEWIDESLPERYRPLVTVRHFHALCSDFCRKAGLPFASPRGALDGRFWLEEAPGLLLDALDLVPDRFDALVVDEGQDFHPPWWVPVESLLREPETGGLFVFYDPAQNLFTDLAAGPPIPGLGEPFALTVNCRNTRQIAALCGRIQGMPLPTRPGAPLGADCEVQLAEGDAEQRSGCERRLRDWLGAGRLRPSQVAVLCPRSRENSSLAGVTSLAGRRLTDDLDEWRADEGFLFSTVRSFKGLEADAAILLDVPTPGRIPQFTRNDYYVAASRAKHLLVVLARDGGAVEMAG